MAKQRVWYTAKLRKNTSNNRVTSAVDLNVLLQNVIMNKFLVQQHLNLFELNIWLPLMLFNSINNKLTEQW